MTFANPWLLFLLPLGALLPLWLWRRPPPRPVLSVADLGILIAARGSRPGWRVRFRWLPVALEAVAIALLLVALARPQRGLAETSIPEEGADIVLAFDVSGSMLERTVAQNRRTQAPTKLEAARVVIDDFIESLPGNRIGLAIFQSRSLVMSPLTNDHEALRSTVRTTESGLLPDGTAIGLGLTEALNLLRESRARSRVVVLLTDGQNNSGEVHPLQGAQMAKALGIRVYTVGFVTSGPGDVDAQMLRRVAEETGGTYHDATSQTELAKAYADIGTLERSRIGERIFTAYQEFAPWLAALATALLVGAAALRATMLRRYP